MRKTITGFVFVCAVALLLLATTGHLKSDFAGPKLPASSESQQRSLPCVIGYQIVSRPTLEEEAEAVTEQLGFGWQTAGGVEAVVIPKSSATATDVLLGRISANGGTMFLQAMTRVPC